MKEEFLMLLRSVNREGMDELINFIDKSDFFKTLFLKIIDKE